MADSASAALAARIVVAGGSGDGEDVAAVRPEIARLSPDILQTFVDKGATVVACRGSVTDVERSLRGKVPRGWEGVGRTWDSVPGTYLTKGKRVLVATVEAPGGGRMMPATGASHGSSNLALHETLHGHHYLTGQKVLKVKRFIDARTADFGRLPPYLKQKKRPGLEETYAESGARFFQRDPALAGDWPALFAYWSGAPIPAAPSGGAGVLASLHDEAGEEEEDEGPGEPAIGSAEIAPDGTITLDLRAGARGMVGHAVFILRPGDPEYERVRAHSFPGSGGGASVLASVGSEPTTALVRPFGIR